MLTLPNRTYGNLARLLIYASSSIYYSLDSSSVPSPVVSRTSLLGCRIESKLAQFLILGDVSTTDTHTQHISSGVSPLSPHCYLGYDSHI